ncbi:MAG TPA: methyltransferase domain-containing protein [Gaiellaceae bacterium]|jgi:ubiquinone/menaquinone biosynthesis C-methylase UbiE|nr:methyltransferase domain-containing protein [Gaiellaceae bacterium]
MIDLNRYVMEDARGARRLAGKVDPETWVEAYIRPLLRPGSRVLDVGCGSGTMTAAASATYPECEFVAVDRSDARVRVAAEALSAFENATATLGWAEELPFDDESFDLVWTRFLLEHVPDKGQVVAELARVTRPGGRLLLQDLDGQLVNHYPPDPLLEVQLTRALAILGGSGFDPNVGRKLHSLLYNAGLHELDVRIEPYHTIIGAIEPRARRRWKLKLAIAADALEEAGYSRVAEGAERLLAYLDREDTSTFSHLFTACGTKPSVPL